MCFFEGSTALSHPLIPAGTIGAPIITPVLLPISAVLMIINPSAEMIAIVCAPFVFYAATFSLVQRWLAAAVVARDQA